jgi:hypothetical protein
MKMAGRHRARKDAKRALARCCSVRCFCRRVDPGTIEAVSARGMMKDALSSVCMRVCACVRACMRARVCESRPVCVRVHSSVTKSINAAVSLPFT